jgi:hypothetical protein
MLFRGSQMLEDAERSMPYCLAPCVEDGLA